MACLVRWVLGLWIFWRRHNDFFLNMNAHDTTYVPTNHRLIMQNETVASQFNLLSMQFLSPISRLFSAGNALNSCAHQNWFAAAKEIIYSLIYLTRLGECRVLGHACLLCAVCAPYEVNGPAGIATVLSKTYPVTWKTNKWIYFCSFMTFWAQKINKNRMSGDYYMHEITHMEHSNPRSGKN